MENYIIRAYQEGQKRNKQQEQRRKRRNNSLDKKRRARVIEMFEQANGFIGPEEIAEATGIDVEKVKEYLGEKRLERYDSLLAQGEKQASEEKTTKQKREEENLTHTKVERLASARNKRVMELNAEGLTIQEIAKIEKLTINQVKEIFLSLGLSIYTPEQLAEIREAEERRKKLEGEREQGQESKREEGEERRKGKKQRGDGKRRREKDGVVIIENYEDLRREMKRLIKDGKSKEAIRLGKYFLTDEEATLSEEEKKELRERLGLIIDIIEKYRNEEEQER